MPPPHFDETVLFIKQYNTFLSRPFKFLMRTHLTLILTLALSHQLLAQRHDNPSHYLKSAARKLPIILKAAAFNAGEQVADIGAGSGWFDAAIGIYQDSLTFVLEDIDSSFIRESRLNEALLAYSKVKGTPINCTYTQVIGTEKSSTLASSRFDKVLLIDTYHHLRFRQEMIDDLCRILRTGGRLVVYEPVGKTNGEIFKACNSLLFTAEEIISSFRDKGLQLERSDNGTKTAGKRAKLFVFVKL